MVSLFFIFSRNFRGYAKHEKMSTKKLSIGIISLTSAPRRSLQVCKHPDNRNRMDAVPVLHHDFLQDFVGIAWVINRKVYIT